MPSSTSTIRGGGFASHPYLANSTRSDSTLLDQRVNPSLRNNFGRYDVLWELLPVADSTQPHSRLLDDGRNPNLPNNPRRYAALSSQLSRLKGKSDPQELQILLEKLPDREIQEYLLTSLLYVAINEQYDLPMINLLLEKGANPNRTDGFDKSTMLFALQQKCSPKIIGALLKKYADIDKPYIGYTLLHWAIYYECDLSVFETLLKGKVNPNQLGAWHEPAVLFALEEKCSPEIISALLRGFIGIYQKYSGDTLLHSAVKLGSDLPSFEALLKKKARQNRRDSIDKSALLFALEKGCSPEIISALLGDVKAIIFDKSFQQLRPSEPEKENDQKTIQQLMLKFTDLNKDQKASWSESLVYWAISSDCKWPLVEDLLKNISHQKNYLWKHLLGLAIRMQYGLVPPQSDSGPIRTQHGSKTIKGLLAKNASLDKIEALSLYYSLLSHALRYQLGQKIIEKLLQKIKGIEAKSKTEDLAIHLTSVEKKKAQKKDAINHDFVALAIQNGYPLTNIILPLLKRVKNINQQGSDGGLLHLAALHPDSVQILNTLLKKGANPKLENNFGKSSLLWAIQKNGTPASIEVLLEAEKISADKKEQWMSGLLKYAIERGSNLSTIQTLLQNGANPNLTVDFDGPILFFAIEKKSNPEVIEALLKEVQKTLDNPSDASTVLTREGRDFTLLDWAVECGSNLAIFEILEQNKANPYLKDAFKRSVVTLAISKQYESTIIALLLRNFTDKDQHEEIKELLCVAVESGATYSTIKECLLGKEKLPYSVIEQALFLALRKEYLDKEYADKGHGRRTMHFLLSLTKEIDQNQQKELLAYANSFKSYSETINIIVNAIKNRDSTDHSIKALLSFALKENFNANIVTILLKNFTDFSLYFQNLFFLKKIISSKNKDFELNIALNSLREKMESGRFSALNWFRKIYIQFFLWI